MGAADHRGTRSLWKQAPEEMVRDDRERLIDACAAVAVYNAGDAQAREALAEAVADLEFGEAGA